MAALGARPPLAGPVHPLGGDGRDPSPSRLDGEAPAGRIIRDSHALRELTPAGLRAQIGRGARPRGVPSTPAPWVMIPRSRAG
jgi:hypothetical protein